MANKNTDTIYVEVRAKLDNFQADTNKVATAIRKIEDQSTKTGNQSVSSFLKMGSIISKVFKTLPIIGTIIKITETVEQLAGKIKEYLNKTADAYFRQQKELAALNAIVQTTGASAWTSSAQLNSMAESLSKVTDYTKNDITKMQGRILTYTNITGDNFKRTQKAAIDMATVMGVDLSSAAETLGRALDSPAEGLDALTRLGFRFRDDLKEQIALLVQHGDTAQAQTLILNEVENVYQGVAYAQNSVTNKTERLKQVQEELNAEIGRTTSGFTNFAAGIKLSWKEAQLFEMRQRRIAESASDNEAKITSYTKNINDLKKSLDDLIAEGVNDERLISIRVRIENAESTLNLFINDAATAQEQVEHYRNELQRLDPLMRNIIQQEGERLNFLNAIRRTQQLISEYQAAGNDSLVQTYQGMLMTQQAGLVTHERILANNWAQITPLKEQLDLWQARLQIAEQGQQATIRENELNEKIATNINAITALEKEREAAIKKRGDAILAAGVALSHERISIEEHHQRVMNAYTEEADQLTIIEQKVRDLKLQEDDGTGEERKAKAIRETNIALSNSIAQEQQRREILADISMNKVYEDLEAQLTKLTGTQKDIIALERRMAWEAIEKSDDYIHASEGVRDKIKAVFDAIHDYAEKKASWERLKELTQEYGSSIGNVITSFGNLLSTITQKEVDEELKALDKLYNAKLEYLEKEKQAKLYAKGFIEAQTEEQHQRELELAIESGDQQRIYEAHSTHEKFLIEEEFAQKKAELDEGIAREKAELEYKAAMAQWHSQLSQAMVSAAQAVLGTLASPPYPPANLPLVMLSAAAGAAQISVISANKPKLQSFAEGGIVSGNSFRGDNVLIRANSDEMLLNKRHQRDLFNAIDNNSIGGGQEITIIIPVNLDGREIARSTATHINNRAALINQRSIMQ
ncbi:MAG: phage tail length tape measure family protein [Treponema sp.]|jgi:hypothetical protein|nr:phage tail length tape measure family protein [Treponema sp.]